MWLSPGAGLGDEVAGGGAEFPLGELPAAGRAVLPAAFFPGRRADVAAGDALGRPAEEQGVDVVPRHGQVLLPVLGDERGGKPG